MLSRKAIVLVLTVCTSLVEGDNCMRRNSHVSISSRRNATGHWLATLRLEQQGSPGGTTELMVVDIEPITTRCGDRRTDALIVQLQGPPVPPSPGYDHLLGFGYYKVHEETVSWEEAKIICENEDAHLLILNSEAEANAVHTLIKKHPKLNSWVHIGFHDKINEGHYITIFGQTLAEAGFSRWNANQPDNAGKNENCGSASALSMNLNDLPCTTWKTQFICEQSD